MAATASNRHHNRSVQAAQRSAAWGSGQPIHALRAARLEFDGSTFMVNDMRIVMTEDNRTRFGAGRECKRIGRRPGCDKENRHFPFEKF